MLMPGAREARVRDRRRSPPLYPLKGVWAVLVALRLGSVFIALAGAEPVGAYWAVSHGAFVDY